MIPPELFKRAMVILFGEHWVGRASGHYGINVVKIRRMANGEEEIGLHGIWQSIEQDLRELGESVDAVLLEVIEFNPEP